MQKFVNRNIILILFFWSTSGNALEVSKPLNNPSNLYYDAAKEMDTLLVKEKNPSQSKIKANFVLKNWEGKLGILRYICSQTKEELCKNVLNLAINDRALVVRDYAFTIILASKSWTSVEKSKLSQIIIADENNYRRGLPLWIVDRANDYLENEAK